MDTFAALSTNFNDMLKNLKNGPDATQTKIKPEWNDFVGKIYELYSKKLPKDFLDNSAISHLMFMNSQGDLMAHQIDFIKKCFPKTHIETALKESPVGSPPKAFTWEFDTTHNSIHHLYHISRYERRTSKSFSKFERIIEWGGGYGNFVKIVAGLPDSKLKTYTIIDLPEIAVLQWIYLSSVFGTEAVNLVSPENKLQENKINLVSLPNLTLVDDKYDLFVSTWALSESPIEMHKFVENKQWFGVESLLMAIHQCGGHIPFMEESTNIGLAAKKFGATIEDIKVIPGKNCYLFK